MRLPVTFPHQPNAKLIGFSRHQQVWKIGWTKPVTSFQVYRVNDKYYTGRPQGQTVAYGYRCLASGQTCNYVRTLHDGRVMEAWAYPAEPDDVPAVSWPDEFWNVLTGEIGNRFADEREERILRQELVEQLTSVIKYGMQQHETAVRLVYEFAKDRLTRPENGLALLFQTWNK